MASNSKPPRKIMGLEAGSVFDGLVPEPRSLEGGMTPPHFLPFTFPHIKKNNSAPSCHSVNCFSPQLVYAKNSNNGSCTRTSAIQGSAHDFHNNPLFKKHIPQRLIK